MGCLGSVRPCSLGDYQVDFWLISRWILLLLHGVQTIKCLSRVEAALLRLARFEALAHSAQIRQRPDKLQLGSKGSIVVGAYRPKMLISELSCLFASAFFLQPLVVLQASEVVVAGGAANAVSPQSSLGRLGLLN